MDACCEKWVLTFKDTPTGMNLKFDSEIKPVTGAANDYALAANKPSINGVTLIGNKSNEELLIDSIPNEDIEKLLKNFI